MGSQDLYSNAVDCIRILISQWVRLVYYNVMSVGHSEIGFDEVPQVEFYSCFQFVNNVSINKIMICCTQQAVLHVLVVHPK